MVERLQVQAVSDQHYLEDCLNVFGAVADEDDAVVVTNSPLSLRQSGDSLRHRYVLDGWTAEAIVENFFGRVCLLWKISLSTYVWDHKFFDGIQRLTFALTNFHLGLMPLREDDQHQYRSVLARYARMAEEKRTTRAATQRRYVQRRAERLATDMLRSSFAARAPFMSPSGRR
ncbi:hypothetical protein DYB31_015878 [Aphanomyces astaci]|uniref:DDE Tnp4 domain-containing protein n=1 Tax=Aphanomyces astaci TaxID=112090 RepID=A0A397ELT7_APHAT|nr:hypothetical protein DYB31_015878 [Aphanomyces astaci]